MNVSEWQGWITLILVGCVFPFGSFYFRKNERLHEETQKAQVKQDLRLGEHHWRLKSLEDWRTYERTGQLPPPGPPTEQ